MSAASSIPLVPPVVLLGPPGAGKSTLGRSLAARIGFSFVDLDDRVDVSLLRREGEASFRVAEHAALAAALQEGAVVIAAGAGVVDTAASRALLSRACCVVVDVDVDTALSRIPDGTRPWLPDRGAGDRRAVWLSREQGRDAHRLRAGCGVVDGRVEVEDAARRAEALVRAFRVGSSDRDEVNTSTTLPDVVRSGFVIADAVVAPRLARVDVVVDDGARKDAARLIDLLAALHRHGVTRQDRIVAVGGGALLDVCGLAGSLHHRGTPWVAVPTTLLAMVDAALGGKTAMDVEVDGAVVRNGAGTFWDPVDVVLWPRFLETLSPAALRHGRAEMLKHALLAGLDARAVVQEEAITTDTIATSRSIKRFVVERDPRERHLRMALNLGHSFAHAFESRFGVAHGDAVLHGLRFMARAAREVVGLAPEVVVAIDELVERLSPPPLPAFRDEDVDALLTAMRRDKKRDGQGIRLVLLAAPGAPVLARVDEEVLRSILTTRGPHGAPSSVVG